MPQAVASALRVREEPGRPLTETLEDTLRARQMLLVMDNCEHLIEGVVRLVDALLGTCPRLRVLATSRETLNAADEVNWVVPSLTVPDSRQKASPAEQLEGYESVRLFIERARQRDPTFVVTPRNGQAVAEICRRLDGIPPAVELAAARVGVLSAEQISERLDHPLKLLTAGGRSAVPRHRTLRATLDWSHELLDEPERELFGRLSVLQEASRSRPRRRRGRGAASAKTMCWTCCPGWWKSPWWWRRQERRALRATGCWSRSGNTRERLEESGKAESVQRRHAALFLALAEEAEPELRGPWQAAWVKKLEREQDNLRAAMAWLLARGELEEAARLGWALWLFWWVRGRFTEGRSWMEEALAKGSAMPATARARALFVAGMMADGQADLRAAQPLIEEGLRLFRELGDKLGHACALGSAGLVEFGRGQDERGIALFEEAVDLFFEAGEEFAAAFMLNFSAAVRLKQGSNARAKRLAEQALTVFREIGGKQGISVALYILAMVAQAERDYERARARTAMPKAPPNSALVSEMPDAPPGPLGWNATDDQVTRVPTGAAPREKTAEPTTRIASPEPVSTWVSIPKPAAESVRLVAITKAGRTRPRAHPPTVTSKGQPQAARAGARVGGTGRRRRGCRLSRRC